MTTSVLKDMKAKKQPTSLTLTLPYPPTINHYYGRGKRGHVYIKTAGIAFRQAVDACVVEDLNGREVAFQEPLTGNLAMSLIIHPPDKRLRDLDNVLKALKDAMEHSCVFHNDNQIKEYREPFKWGEVVKGGKVIVTLQEIVL